MNKNPKQAGNLVLKLYWESHGYKADPIPHTEQFDMRTTLDGTFEIVLWGATSGMAKVPLEGMTTAGEAIRAFDNGEGGLNEFLSKSECQYTHFSIVYLKERNVKISNL
jgi:hypothetical protein